MMEHVFVESKKIFEAATEPCFMPKEYAEPFYHLIRQSVKALSREKCEILLYNLINVFMEYRQCIETKVKCYDKY